MASSLHVAVPRFALPRISLRTTHVRPVRALAAPPRRDTQAHPLSTNAPAIPRWTACQTISTTHIERRPALQCLSPIAQRAFSASPRHLRVHHFDTLKFVQRLKDDGFTEEQAVAMMKVLSDVIEESIQNLTRTMVLREDQEKATYTQKVDFAKLRSELLTADSTESALTRASHERLTNELAKINARLRDEVQRTQASVRLDLNLEKGRIREEANVQELKLKETEARIESETAVLRERLEAVKFSTLQWLIGVCTGTAALILGAWRLLM
ncbi:DUF1640-domain-containing protein [Trichodelitschia bisporula]|uniref:DUF1640-domain-containing protein n=1 Tax=Trichodelitschia bisporula TaxID=703511 RepID=A0A6G1IAN8_9PEZI|nr:DUF1640-domain-containing protein [Trichodelitschia bisporula]